MKIELETSIKNNKTLLKIKLGEGANSVSKTVENFSEPIGPVLANLLNNTRLTVKERDNAEMELSQIISYLTWNPLPVPSIAPTEEIMINESDTLVSDDEILDNLNISEKTDE